MTHPDKRPTFKTLEDMLAYVHQGKIAETHDVQISLVVHKDGESLVGYIDGEQMLDESVMDPGLLVVRLLRIAGVQSERKNYRRPGDNADKARDNARGELAARAAHQSDIPLPLGVIISGERIAEAEPTSNPTPDWAGRTMVVREPSPGSEKDPSGGPIRYIEITSIDGPSASGTWKHGDSHTFCRYTGRCIESSNGAMDGWRIAPYEMRRHLGHEHTKKQEV